MIDRPCIFVARAIHAVFAYLTGWTKFLPFARFGLALSAPGWACFVGFMYVMQDAFNFVVMFALALVVLYKGGGYLQGAAYGVDEMDRLLPAEIPPLRRWAFRMTMFSVVTYASGTIQVVLGAESTAPESALAPVLALGSLLLRDLWLFPAWAVIGGRPPTRTLPGDLRKLRRHIFTPTTYTPTQVPS